MPAGIAQLALALTMPDRVPVIELEPPVKPWWKSRTLWFNAAVAAFASAELSLGALQALLALDGYQLLTVVLVVGNAVLRAVTSKSLASGLDPEQRRRLVETLKQLGARTP